jgi:hypothetical protein
MVKFGAKVPAVADSSSTAKWWSLADSATCTTVRPSTGAGLAQQAACCLKLPILQSLLQATVTTILCWLCWSSRAASVSCTRLCSCQRTVISTLFWSRGLAVGEV